MSGHSTNADRAEEIAEAVAVRSNWKPSSENYARIYQAARYGALAALATNPITPQVDDKFDPDRFGQNVRATLVMRKQSYREAAVEAGVSPATLNRIGRGKMPDLVSYFAVLAWLNGDLAA